MEWDFCRESLQNSSMFSLVDVVGSKLVVADLLNGEQSDTCVHTSLLILLVPAFDDASSLSLGLSEVAVLVASSCPTLTVNKEFEPIHGYSFHVLHLRRTAAVFMEWG